MVFSSGSVSPPSSSRTIRCFQADVAVASVWWVTAALMRWGKFAFSSGLAHSLPAVSVFCKTRACPQPFAEPCPRKTKANAACPAMLKKCGSLSQTDELGWRKSWVLKRPVLSEPVVAVGFRQHMMIHRQTIWCRCPVTSCARWLAKLQFVVLVICVVTCLLLHWVSCVLFFISLCFLNFCHTLKMSLSRSFFSLPVCCTKSVGLTLTSAARLSTHRDKRTTLPV